MKVVMLALTLVIITLAGLDSVVVMKVFTLALTLVILTLAGLRGRTPNPMLAALYTVVMLALLPSFQSTLRCMVFTHLFFAIWLAWFQRERHGRPVSTWLYVGTMILWANLHGGFVIGLFWLLLVV